MCAVAALGLDSKPWTIRDMDGAGNNFVRTTLLLSFSGNYATGGDALDLSAIASQVPSGSLPIVANGPVGSGAGDCQTAEGGYYSIKKGTTILNYTVQVWDSGGTELGAGAYDPEVTADFVVLELLWRKML